MKMFSLAYAAAATLVLAGMGLGGGCATSGYQQAERSIASMNDTRDLIANARRQVGVTMSSLNTIASQPDGDLVAMFGEYGRNLTDVERSALRIQSRAQTMRSRSDKYLSSWEQELGALSSDEARRVSEERRAQTAGEYDALVQSMDVTRAAFDPLMQDLKDIQRLLSTDLTSAGVKSAGSLIAKANEDARVVQGKAALVIRNLDAMTKDMSPPAK